MDKIVKALERRILAAKREIPADLVLKSGKVVNVFSGDIQEKDVAVLDGVIVGVGSDYYGKNMVDLSKRWIVPGLIDAHFHIESVSNCPAFLGRLIMLYS